MSAYAVLVASGGDVSINELKTVCAAADAVYCADGGARFLEEADCLPDVLMGDFDSIHPEVLSRMIRSGIRVETFPAEKDKTDTELALNKMVEAGFTEIMIFGATGSRIDHTLANIHLAQRLCQSQIQVTFCGNNNRISFTRSHIEIPRRAGWYITLLAGTPVVEGVTTSGMKYPLNDAVLRQGDTLGVSNEFSDAIAAVSVKTGLLMIIQSRDN